MRCLHGGEVGKGAANKPINALDVSSQLNFPQKNEEKRKSYIKRNHNTECQSFPEIPYDYNLVELVLIRPG